MYVRKPRPVQAWRVPSWGQAADEPAPGWLVQRMQQNEIYINQGGGLSVKWIGGARHSLPGDWLILTEYDEVEICPADRFNDQFQSAEERAS